jgi:hypothetical protein
MPTGNHQTYLVLAETNALNPLPLQSRLFAHLDSSGVVLAPHVIESGHTFPIGENDLKVLDRILGCLLILGGLGHTVGSLHFYSNDKMTMLWSLCASLFVFLFGALSLLRAGRPRDTALAWICLFAGLCWIAASLRFGVLIGNLFDPRPIVFTILTLGLCFFCLRTLVMKR